MNQLKYTFVLESVSPIAHHSDVYGNIAVAMRRKIRQPDGSFSSVPVVTGDTMRHGLREAGSYALLKNAGMLENADISESALRLLFAGGMISGSSGGSIKLGDYRLMIDLIPHLALLGGCAQNRTIPGRLLVDDALLICDETRHIMPQYVVDWLIAHQGSDDIASCRAHIEEVTRVRMDPSLDPKKREMLSADGQSKIAQQLAMSEDASERGDSVARDMEKSTMMPRSFETVVAGSLWMWRVEAQCWSDLDEDALLVMLYDFLSHARVGGKQGTGHGVMRPAHGWINNGGVHFDITQSRVGSLFERHVSDRADQIAAFLRQVKA